MADGQAEAGAGAGTGAGPRPRDALGRPLPHGTPGVPPLADENLPPAQAVERAQRLLDAGLFFQTHEVFEAVWKRAPEPDRDLWRGLAQLAVGLTHLARGNAVGGSRLLRRGAANLAPYRGAAPSAATVEPGSDGNPTVDVEGLYRWAVGLAVAVDDQRRTDPDATPRYTVPRIVPEPPGPRTRPMSHKVEE